ncbi:ferric enterobactin receptor [Luteibacter rhizovicinus DSM 16549]|uniref:Ferric enterobactin receptor n=1 Tax=Luteibacter rhizovicinus DSM 16549 TaxID=1440763 RepID=A0A1L3EZ24_9GAMM|nr:TonB-dependent receptor [Luteibacter rhizovicinus]APG06329.1 ferric enterobactin receptor [Luteibacter rhizovicinus DSM 16549]
MIVTPGYAQDATPPADAKQARQLDQVVVTGTRSTNRTEAESLSPIDVLSPKDLTSSGATDLATALGRLLPSLDFPRPAINDGNDAVRPASLRGLSPDDTLVLVDGKRYHTSALVNYNNSVGRGAAPADLNSIPISAIDHIEVLRDGAAAQYGSDAIAGVINIVLKHGAGEGKNSINVNGGLMSKRDGDTNGVDGSMGIDLGGKGADAKGWLRVAWNYQDAMNTNRRSPLSLYTPDEAADGNVAHQRYGDPAVKTYQALTNFQYEVAHNIDVYGFLTLSRRDVTSNGYYRAAANSRNVPEVYPNGFLPQIVNHTNDTTAVLGVKGVTDGGWRWDASGNYGINNLAFDIQNSVNTNLYYTTGSSPTYFNAGTFKNSQALANIDIGKDFAVGWLKNPLTLAFGAEYRKEKYQIDAGDPTSYFFDQNTFIPGTTTPYAGGSQVFPGLSPEAAGSFTRHSEALYVDLENDITDKFSAGVAGRYEHYSDAGSTRSGKISGRYQFTPEFALRGTISNGFRAPSLAQQNYQSVVTIIDPTTGQLAQTGTYRTSDPAAVALGAKPLKPEKSANYSLGAVWEPIADFSATLDVYQIRIWHQILYSDTISLTDPLLAAYFNSIVPGQQVTAIQYFANAAATRTRGADLVLNYRIQTSSWGQVNLLASGNYNQVKVLSVGATPEVLQANSTDPIELFGRSSQGILTKATPRTKFLFGADWAIAGFNVHGDLTRYGSVTRVNSDPTTDQVFSARWLLNTSVGYAIDAWNFTVGVDNVTNQYPTRVKANNTGEDFASGLQYSALSPFGFNGRYMYAKVGFRF